MATLVNAQRVAPFLLGALLGAGLNCGPGEVTEVVEELPGDPTA